MTRSVASSEPTSIVNTSIEIRPCWKNGVVLLLAWVSLTLAKAFATSGVKRDSACVVLISLV